MYLEAVYVLAGLTVGLILQSFLPKYYSKKGENLATKEDIAEITDKIESVKHEYANNLESVKAELSSKLNTHGHRYENEYLILSELTGLLVDVRDACLSLRPMLDYKPEGKSEDDIKIERLNRLFEARKLLYMAREKKRPFYPSEIYKAIVDVDSTANVESVKYQYQNPFEKGNFENYWKEAEKNQKEIAKFAEEAMEKIRMRVNKWEALDGGL